MENPAALLLGFALFVLSLWLCLWIAILLPHRMAVARSRSGLGWVLISLFFSPALAIIGLLVLGDARR